MKSYEKAMKDLQAEQEKRRAAEAEIAALKAMLDKAKSDLTSYESRASDAEAALRSERARPPKEVVKEVIRSVPSPAMCDCKADKLKDDIKKARAEARGLRSKLKKANARLVTYGGAIVE